MTASDSHFKFEGCRYLNFTTYVRLKISIFFKQIWSNRPHLQQQKQKYIRSEVSDHFMEVSIHFLFISALSSSF